MRKYFLAIPVFFPVLAMANPVDGPYIGGSAGVNIAGSRHDARGTTRLDTEVGPVGAIALGYGFGNGLRAEIEGSYRSNDLTSISTLRVNGTRLPLANARGSAGTYAVLANLVYDVPFHPFGLSIQPYVGGGLGYAKVDLGGAGGNAQGRLLLPQNNVFSGPLDVRFREDDVLAYQAIVGASLPVSGIAGLDVTFDYRFFGTTRADIPVTRTGINAPLANGAVPRVTTRNGFSVRDNSLLLGVRYAFGH